MRCCRFLVTLIAGSCVCVGIAHASERYLRPLAASGAGDYLVVQSLVANMPAERFGVLAGDTLLQVDDVALSNLRQLTDHLRQIGKRDSTDLLIGRATGRVIIRALPDARSRRLGMNLLGTIMTDSAAALITPALAVSVGVVEFGDGTWVRADVRNNGGSPLSFGPDSITVLDGNNVVQAAITPQDLLSLKFGGSITDVAGMTHHNMGDAIASGIMSGWAQGTREAYTRSVLQNALHESQVPPDSRYGGAVFYPAKKMLKPVRIRVHVSGLLFTSEFGDSAY